MTDRTSSKQKSAVVVTTETATEVDALEEKVARMRQGWAASDDLELEQVGQDLPDVAAKLREIELRALEMSGRLQELRQDTGLESPASNDSTKDKIIERLAQKSSPQDD